MREYEMETTFDVPLQTFLRVVYGDDGVCLKKFHEECGGCHAAVVPPWIGDHDSESNQIASRSINFSKPMELPSVIERLLGPSASKKAKAGASFSFVEHQDLSVDSDSGTVTVSSAAQLDSQWVGKERAQRFAAEIKVTYSSVIDVDFTESTKMNAVIQVTATGAWALQPVVERMMEHRSVSGFREFVQWTDTHLSEKYGIDCDENLPGLKVLGFEPTVTDGDVLRTSPTIPEIDHGVVSRTKKKYPVTPGGVSRSNSHDDEFVETPPRDEPAPSSSERNGTREEKVSYASTSEDVSDDGSDDGFDDAVSSKSGSSFVSAVSRSRSVASSRSSGKGRGSGTVTPTRSGGYNSSAHESHDESENDDDGALDDQVRSASKAKSNVASPTTPSRGKGKKNTVVIPRLATTPTGTPQQIPSTPTRLDDQFANGWFMQTVMKDLGVLKSSSAETRQVVLGLEENLRALRAEQAAMKAAMRRNGHPGYGLDHRGDSNSGTREVRWTLLLSLAVGAGYCVGMAVGRDR
tara:strand:+ start:2959 stop:4521 length:1563 start_codon:yes stop_codon:yes gene_type:complete